MKAAKRAHKVRWRDADIRRAIVAAQRAGLDSYRVEIAPDGTIAIVIGEQAPCARRPRPLR